MTIQVAKPTVFIFPSGTMKALIAGIRDEKIVVVPESLGRSKDNNLYCAMEQGFWARSQDGINHDTITHVALSGRDTHLVCAFSCVACAAHHNDIVNSKPDSKPYRAYPINQIRSLQPWLDKLNLTTESKEPAHA